MRQGRCHCSSIGLSQQTGRCSRMKTAVTGCLLLSLLLVACNPSPPKDTVSEAPASEPTASEATPSPASTAVVIDPAVQSCTTAMLQTRLKISEWEAGLKQHCLPLDAEQQELAKHQAEQQSESDGKRIHFYKASDSIGEFARGSLPYSPSAMSDDEEWLALQGNYQAQRNFAYSLSKQNTIAACAWRWVIIQSGHQRVDTTDTGNLKVYCGQLDQVEIEAAENQAKILLGIIKKGGR